MIRPGSIPVLVAAALGGVAAASFCFAIVAAYQIRELQSQLSESRDHSSRSAVQLAELREAHSSHAVERTRDQQRVEAMEKELADLREAKAADDRPFLVHLYDRGRFLGTAWAVAASTNAPAVQVGANVAGVDVRDGWAAQGQAGGPGTVASAGATASYVQTQSYPNGWWPAAWVGYGGWSGDANLPPDHARHPAGSTDGIDPSQPAVGAPAPQFQRRVSTLSTRVPPRVSVAMPSQRPMPSPPMPAATAARTPLPAVPLLRPTIPAVQTAAPAVRGPTVRSAR